MQIGCSCNGLRNTGNKEQFDMTTRKDVKREPDLAEPVVPAPGGHAITERDPVGRVVHDERGNAVWKWGADTSSTGTTSGILEHIEPHDLKVQGSSESRGPDAGGGYDPYNQGQPRTRTTIPKKKDGPGKR
jgi:hypothetical protein